MKVRKAVITAAGRKQRALPLQTLVSQDGVENPVLGILIEEVVRANVEEICVVVSPGDEAAYARAAGDHRGRVCFVPQSEPRGYGHALYCARAFVGDDPFLHLVGDHVYVSRDSKGCAEQLIEVAEAEQCSVSAVETTRESQLFRYGTVGGHRVTGRAGLYRVETVVEKPTPTEAEQSLVVPGLRAGYYLCFFGMHVLTPLVMDILAQQVAGGGSGISLSTALAELARREQYLALEQSGRRYDVGARYGILNAQLALALSGRDREEVLSQLLELLAGREMTTAGK